MIDVEQRALSPLEQHPPTRRQTAADLVSGVRRELDDGVPDFIDLRHHLGSVDPAVVAQPSEGDVRPPDGRVDDAPGAVDVLYASESTLNKACAPLQEASYRRLSGDAVDPVLKLKAYNALDFCEATARDVEDLLWRIDPETAGHYLDRPLVSIRAAQ